VPAFSIASVHTEFVGAQNRTASFLTSAQTFQLPGGRSVHVRDVEEIAGLALLKMTLAWESFVEETFLRYLCGARSAAGVAPTLLAPKYLNLQAAFKSLVGGAQYLGWHPDTTVKRAAKYFDPAGDPFLAPVGGAKSDLIEMADVRNRIAHRSDHSVQAFQDVVRSHFGFVPRGMTPGRFLLAPLPTGVTAFDHYAAQLTATAHLVANYV